MAQIITTNQMREVDRLMIEEYGISLVQMMENAGRNLADLALKLLYRKESISDRYNVVVVCGTGNNGGGGMVASRFLSNRNVDVIIILAGQLEKLKPVPAERWETILRLPVTTIVADSSDKLGVFENADLIIDAIIGYGLIGEPRGIQAYVIREIINSQNPNVLSLDIPSGLNSTDGSAGEICIRAAATMTLALPKTGLTTPESREYVGELYLADIGVPPELYKQLGLSSQYLFNEETILHVNPNSKSQE